MSVSGSFEITTPAACIEVCLGRASSFFAVSISLLDSASF